MAHPNSELRVANYEIRNKLYYEYDKSKVSFTEPREEFVIELNKLEEFIRNNLAPQLGLNQKETEDLIAEVRNEITSYELRVTNYEFLKISLIDRKELDKKLPVEVTPKPDKFYRIHLLLTPLTGKPDATPPNLEEIRRGGFTVIEIGAIYNNLK